MSDTPARSAAFEAGRQAARDLGLVPPPAFYQLIAELARQHHRRLRELEQLRTSAETAGDVSDHDNNR